MSVAVYVALRLDLGKTLPVLVLPRSGNLSSSLPLQPLMCAGTAQGHAVLDLIGSRTWLLVCLSRHLATGLESITSYVLRTPIGEAFAFTF